MRKVSVFSLALLFIVGVAAFLRPPPATPGGSDERFDLPGRFPYSIGEFQGKDLTEEDARQVAILHGWSPKAVVLRQYLSHSGGPIDVYMVMHQSVDLTQCYYHNGWVVDFLKQTRLGDPERSEVREFVAFSPPGLPDSADACLFYVKGKDHTVSKPLSILLQSDFNIFSRFEEPSISVRLCTPLENWQDKGEYEAAFSQLKSFALPANQILQRILGARLAGGYPYVDLFRQFYAQLRAAPLRY